jgi:SAM-dependent methyltransferase
VPQYRDSVLALLDKQGFSPAATALEVGPGDGGFLPDLARRFHHVTALDNSPAMLELARQLCERESTGQRPPAPGRRACTRSRLQADCVVVNMVLAPFRRAGRCTQADWPPCCNRAAACW